MLALYTLMLPVSTLMGYNFTMSTNLTTARKCKEPAKPYHHGDLRTEILRAASELLEENNITSLSLRAVAKRAGVSHTAPYRHFKDKESLLAGIACLGFERLSLQMTQAVASHPNDPVSQLLATGRQYVKLVLEYPQCTHLMFSGILPCDDTYPILKAAGNAAFDGLKFIIEAGQLSGVFRSAETELLALTAWSGMHGLGLLLVTGDLPDILSIPADPDEITAAVTKLLLEGLQSSK